MASGDGLIVRIRTGARPLSSAALRIIARLAQAHGSGVVELTRRGNLQLRGVRSDALEQVQQALVEHQLAEVDPDLERALAILVHPLAGEALQLLAEGVERALRAVEDWRGLPAKFGVVLDDASGALDGVYADIRVLAQPPSAAGDTVFIAVAGDARSALGLGACVSADAPRVVARLARRAAECGNVGRGELRRLLSRDLVALQSWLPPDARYLYQPQMTPDTDCKVSHDLTVGYHECARSDAPSWVVAGVPFGSAPAELWLQLADFAEHFGRAEVRLTPARTVVIPGVSAPHRDALSRAGLIVDPADPLLHVDACPGAPACSEALGDTRQIARELAASMAPALSAGASLHVSGCAKGCAHSGPADITLVRDAAGCKLGFGASSEQLAETKPLPLDDARRTLSSWAR